jgi:hypothetical protein
MSVSRFGRPLFLVLLGVLTPHLMSCSGRAAGGSRGDAPDGSGGGDDGSRGDAPDGSGGGNGDGDDGTCNKRLVVAITLDPATATANQLEVTLTIEGGTPAIKNIAHEPGRTTDAIDSPLDPSVAGKRVSVLVIAIRDNQLLGNGSGVQTADACGATVPVMVQSRTTYVVPAQPNNMIDILVVMDNSLSMVPLQTKFLASFVAFIDVLKAMPAGLPDIHLGVVSSDTGPGQYALPERQCAFRGDKGGLQHTPRGTCATSPFTSANTTFLAASSNQTTKNYNGDIVDAFNCIAALGNTGCSFGGQLKAARWALDPMNVPAGNEGFFRNQAFLAIIVLTNQDDCSLPDDSDLVNPNQTLLSDPLGPLSTFRCSEFGHLCNINGTLQPPPRGPASDLQQCQSNEGPTGLLSHVNDEVYFLKSLKADPAQVVVAVIAGPPTPYSIENAVVGTQTEPRMVHSCTQSSTEYGSPAVRLSQWTQAFGGRGTFLPVCAASFAPALTQIATNISRVVGPQCLPDVLRDADPTTPSLDLECDVTDRYVNDQGQSIETALQACAANGNVKPCWVIAPDSKCTPSAAGSLFFSVSRAAAPPTGLYTKVFCASCAPGFPQPGCP